MNLSIKLETPCEFINITPFNPLISKCQIKVCYVGDEPNRNKSIITKEVAKEMANSLPGSPIVGYYSEVDKDYEEHNRVIEIANGKIKFKDTTRPYGFVDLHAKCWFQKFDDDGVIHEYLMTEGWLWTGQYPEVNRVIEKGNNQSMELDDKLIDAYWSKDSNGKPEFFIINEAIISKLCILGEDVEPCFEGAQITKVQFSLEDEFKQTLYSMISELTELLNEGGAPMFNRYAVEIGDSLWSALWSYVWATYPDGDCGSLYSIDGIFEDNSQKFAILQNRKDMKYYRLDFTLDENNGFKANESLTEVTKSYTPASEPQFDPASVAAYEETYKKKNEEDEKDGNPAEGEEPKKDEAGEEPAKDDEGTDDDEDDKKKKKYSLEDIPEYQELSTQYSQLQSDYEALKTSNADLEAQITELTKFKQKIERKEKQAMIDSFYMLSDTDKKDCLDNIDNYSLHDIEAQLSILCVRNKVNFNLGEESEGKNSDPTTYNLEDSETDDAPAWIKAVREVQNNLN